jgi:exonuclease III
MYMTGDMNRATRSGKGCTPMFNGMFYTLLSRSKSSDKVKILNFDLDCIKVSEVVKIEMERLRNECILSWKHPLLSIGNGNICLLNIVSWNLHMPHIVSDKCYMSNSDIFCFTETHTTNTPVKKIEDYASGWKSIHHPYSVHGLAICYRSDKVVVIKEFPAVNEIEMLPVLLQINDEHVLIVLVYQPPGRPRNVFPYQLLQQLSRLNEVQTYRTIVLGDFNADHMLSENVTAYAELCQRFNFSQRSNYSTHIYGGILDLVFDTRKSSPVQWMPSPYSDHFVMMIDL